MININMYNSHKKKLLDIEYIVASTTSWYIYKASFFLT